MPHPTPYNFSDDVLIYGSQVSAAVAALAAWLSDQSFVEIFIAVCNGMIFGALLLFAGLMLVGQPPGVWIRVKRGERID